MKKGEGGGGRELDNITLSPEICMAASLLGCLSLGLFRDNVSA